MSDNPYGWAPVAYQPRVEFLGDHRYLVSVQQGDDVIEIRIRATPDLVLRLALEETDEARIINATAAYLLARQHAAVLPPFLDLDDVAAAYAGFEDDLRTQLTPLPAPHRPDPDQPRSEPDR
jgi:hypothetical protein